MKQLRLEKKNNNRIRVFRAYIDEVYIGPVYTVDLKKAEIELDGVTPTEEGSEIRYETEIEDVVGERLYSVIYEKAFSKYASLLAGAEYCSMGIRRKMKEKDYPEDIIDSVIDALYKERYLDDKRFAESYIRSYARTKSRELIVRELEFKNIGGDWLYDILDEVYDDESLSKDDVIKSLLEKKFRNQDLSDPKVKMRAANFLIRKGFSFGDISSYLT